MNHKRLLVKELITRVNETTEIEGTILTPLPIKDIYEVNHSISSQRYEMGSKSIAIVGEVVFKIIFIDCNDNTLRQVEEKLPYRCFCILKNNECLLNPMVKVHTCIEDIFVEIADSNLISIMGFLSFEIVLYSEKEMTIGELKCFELKTKDRQEDISSEDTNLTIPFCDVVKETHQISSSEVITELKAGSEQDLTITLDNSPEHRQTHIRKKKTSSESSSSE